LPPWNKPEKAKVWRAKLPRTETVERQQITAKSHLFQELKDEYWRWFFINCGILSMMVTPFIADLEVEILCFFGEGANVRYCGLFREKSGPADPDRGLEAAGISGL
jgi:hypothetical protein